MSSCNLEALLYILPSVLCLMTIETIDYMYRLSVYTFDWQCMAIQNSDVINEIYMCVKWTLWCKTVTDLSSWNSTWKQKTQFFSSSSTIKTSCRVKGEWAGLGGERLQLVCGVRHADLQSVNSVKVFLRLNEASGEV